MAITVMPMAIMVIMAAITLLMATDLILVMAALPLRVMVLLTADIVDQQLRLRLHRLQLRHQQHLKPTSFGENQMAAGDDLSLPFFIPVGVLLKRHFQ